jgi:hypothetical protein
MDLQARLQQHIEASTRRDQWARRALALLKAGKDKAGMVAARKAEYWDARAKSLEPR